MASRGSAGTGSSRSPTTSARPTCATRSPRAPSRRSTSSSRRSGSSPAMRVLDVGLRAGPPRPCARRAAGSRCIGVDISERFVELARQRRAAPGATFERGRRPRAGLRRRVRRRHLALPGRVRPRRRRPGRRADSRRRRSRRRGARRHGPGGAPGRSRRACRRSRAYFQVRFLEDARHASTPHAG